MKKRLSIIFTMLLLCNEIVQSQNIFPEKFEGCITDQFSLEMDTVIAKINVQEFINILFSNIDEKTKSKINGELFLQIIVDMEGRSCLMSIDNQTNIKTKKLDLKNTIDKNIIWEKPREKVSPIIVLEFKENRAIYFNRMGRNGDTGWRIINKT